jgi:hypothetical protein
VRDPAGEGGLPSRRRPAAQGTLAWHFGNVLAGVLTGRVPDTSNAPTHDRTPATIDVELEKAE